MEKKLTVKRCFWEENIFLYRYKIKVFFQDFQKKIWGFDKRPLYVTMYTMKEGNIWIEDDLKEIMETVKAGKYYSGMENREED